MNLTIQELLYDLQRTKYVEDVEKLLMSCLSNGYIYVLNDSWKNQLIGVFLNAKDAELEGDKYFVSVYGGIKNVDTLHDKYGLVKSVYHTDKIGRPGYIERLKLSQHS